MFIVKGHGHRQDKQTWVERLFHKMLCVDVLYQLLLLTEAPHTVAALAELHLHPLKIHRIPPGLDQLWVLLHSDSRPLFLLWNLTFVLFSNLIPQSFWVAGLNFLSLSTSTPSISLVILTLYHLCLSAPSDRWRPNQSCLSSRGQQAELIWIWSNLVNPSTSTRFGVSKLWLTYSPSERVFFSWLWAPRAYLFRKLNRWVCSLPTSYQWTS